MEQDKFTVTLTRHEVNTLIQALNTHSGHWMKKAQEELETELEKDIASFDKFNTYMAIFDESSELFNKIMDATIRG